MKPLKVMMLHAPTAMAGAEGVILNINRFLATSEKVRIFNCPFINFSRGDSPYLQKLEDQGINYEAVPLGRRFEYRYIKETRRLIKKYHIDLIHSHGYRSDITAILAAGRKVPIVSTIHGFTANSSRVKFYEYIQRVMLKYIHILMPVSIPIEKQLIKIGIPQSRIRKLSNVVDNEAIAALVPSTIFSDLSINKNVTKIVFVGRLSVEKGLDILIDACSIFKQRGLPFYLIIIGDGPMKEKYEAAVKSMSLTSEIRLLGFRKDAVEITAASDIFVLPSRTEGIPLVALEAMALGRPVVASNVGGLPHLIQHNKDGLLVPPEDAERLADALEWVSRHPEKANEFGKTARAHIQKEYSPQNWAAKLISIYYLAAGRNES